jgi:hypothetical protein
MSSSTATSRAVTPLTALTSQAGADDLLVIGRGGLDRLPLHGLGSTAHSVLVSARCTVLVVPQPVVPLTLGGPRLHHGHGARGVVHGRTADRTQEDPTPSSDETSTDEQAGAPRRILERHGRRHTGCLGLDPQVWPPPAYLVRRLLGRGVCSGRKGLDPLGSGLGLPRRVLPPRMGRSRPGAHHVKAYSLSRGGVRGEEQGGL